MKWFKEEKELEPNEDLYNMRIYDDSVQLNIISAKPEFAGTYFVELTNDAGKVSSNKAQLIVNSNIII